MTCCLNSIFQNINYYRGHAVSDRILASAADILKTTLRKNDLLARTEGDHFILILMEASEDKAEIVAKKISDVIGKFDFCDRSTNKNGTISSITYRNR